MAPWKDPEDRLAINASLKQDIADLKIKEKNMCHTRLTGSDRDPAKRDKPKKDGA